MLYFIALYCIVLYCIVLYCIVFYCIVQPLMRNPLLFFSDATIGTTVTRVKAIDPDASSALTYAFADPKKAWDPFGNPVDLATFDYAVSGSIFMF